MPQNWNRKTRRQMSRYGLGQQMMRDELDKVERTARNNATEYAFAACFLALHRLHGFDGEQLHQLAVQSVNIIQNSLCASDVVKKVKALTGFDVHRPIPQEELEPWNQEGLDDEDEEV